MSGTKTLNFMSKHIVCFLTLILSGVLFSCNEKEVAPVAVTGVTLSKDSIHLTEGDTYDLEAFVFPEDAYDKTVSWSSSNTAVATVKNGKVTAVKSGNAVITVKTEDGGKTATCSVSVSEKVYPVTGVSLNKTSLDMVEGDVIVLTATVSPENATNKNVTWASDDQSVATVEDGKVTAIKSGTATVTVKTEDGGMTASCSVTVTDKKYPVTGVELDKTSIELTEGDVATLTATITPENATNKSLIWTSDNAAVATVQDGKVTAVAKGNATITVTTEDGGKTATCSVKVNAKVYAVTGVSLNKTSLDMVEGDVAVLTATITPDNATNKNVTWSSSNSSVVTVEDGKVTAIKSGTATITVKTEDGGMTASCSVNVADKKYPVTGVELDKSSVELTEGDVATLTATITPSNATNKNLIWSTDNSAVATVKDGQVTAVSKGSATITVTTEDGGKTATCSVKVNAKVYSVTGVTLSKTSVELTEGDVAMLVATITPDNATNKNVAWSTSNPAVATVKDGKITAISKGNATITVTTEDGGKTATCSVKVNAKVYPVTGVTLNKTSVELTEGDETTLVATITPDNATNKNVSWSSSNPAVVSVKDGKVTAVSKGDATITVTTEDGGKTATCSVKVNEKVYPVTGVTLSKTSVELTEGDVAMLVATITPDNATNKNVTWTSSNPAVATVKDGKITAVSKGNATITVTTEDGGKTATCSVKVNAKVYPVTGVTLNKTSVELTEGDETNLIATITPDNATNKNVTWSSSNPAVAAVNDGKVTAVTKGSATITVVTEDGGWKASCVVNVKERTYSVTGVTLDVTSVTLVEGDQTVLNATITPSNATNKNIRWTSSDNGVATVDKGVVTAVKPGVATITVTTEDGGMTATCSVTVEKRVYPVTGVTLDKTSVELTEGDETTLTATVTPSYATNKNVVWSSNDESVANVHEGRITAIKPGVAIITVTTEDGGMTASCSVTVKERVYPVTGVTLDKSSVELKKGETVTLTATVAPDNATNKNVVWSSSDSSIAKVENGVVTAVESGTATITVTTEDGNLKASCVVTVKRENDFNIGDWEEDGTDNGGTAE